MPDVKLDDFAELASFVAFLRRKRATLTMPLGGHGEKRTVTSDTDYLLLVQEWLEWRIRNLG